MAGVPGNRLELNAKLAATMGAPVLLALDLQWGLNPVDLANSAAIARDTVAKAGADVLGVVLNHVPLCRRRPCSPPPPPPLPHPPAHHLHDIRVQIPHAVSAQAGQRCAE